MSARRKICREEKSVKSAPRRGSRRPPAAPDLTLTSHSPPRWAWETEPPLSSSPGGGEPSRARIQGWGRFVPGRDPPSHPHGSSRPLSLLCRQPAQGHAETRTRLWTLLRTPVHMLEGTLPEPSVHTASPTVVHSHTQNVCPMDPATCLTPLHPSQNPSRAGFLQGACVKSEQRCLLREPRGLATGPAMGRTRCLGGGGVGRSRSPGAQRTSCCIRQGWGGG